MTQSECNTRAPVGESLLAIYLGVSLVAALPSWRTPGWIVAAHVVALVTVVTLIVRRSNGPIAQWLPLVALPFLYAELPLLMRPVLHDSVVQHWEAAIWTVSPAQSLAGRYPSALLSELLHLGYLSYYPLIYLPPLLLWVKGRRPEFERTVATLIAVYGVCFTIFILFPVAGPRYEWPAPAGIPAGPVRAFVLMLLGAGSSKGAAFPSSHVAVAVAQTVVALRLQPRVGRVTAYLTVMLALGAVYGGFHYGVDALAGAALGLTVAVLAMIAFRARDRSAVDSPRATDALLAG